MYFLTCCFHAKKKRHLLLYEGVCVGKEWRLFSLGTLQIEQHPIVAARRGRDGLGDT